MKCPICRYNQTKLLRKNIDTMPRETQASTFICTNKSCIMYIDIVKLGDNWVFDNSEQRGQNDQKDMF